jgi:hypothetical protein
MQRMSASWLACSASAACQWHAELQCTPHRRQAQQQAQHLQAPLSSHSAAFPRTQCLRCSAPLVTNFTLHCCPAVVLCMVQHAVCIECIHDLSRSGQACQALQTFPVGVSDQTDSVWQAQHQKATKGCRIEGRGSVLPCHHLCTSTPVYHGQVQMLPLQQSCK